MTTMAKKSSKGTATPTKVIAQRENAAAIEAKPTIPADVQAIIDAKLKKERDDFEKGLAAKTEKLIQIATLEAERATVKVKWDEADERLREIDKELGKLGGAAPKTEAAKAEGGKRHRRTAEQMANEKQALEVAGAKLYKILKSAGKGVDKQAIDLKKEVDGADVGAAIERYVAADLVKRIPNGKYTSYHFLKDGELP